MGFLIFSPLIVSAVDVGPQDQIQPPFKDVDGIIVFLQAVIIKVYQIFFIVAVGFILWAAFIYLTAGGDSAKVDQAKKRLMNAVIAIVIALVASGVSSIISSIF